MHITCKQENLHQGLSIVSNIASKNVTLPILNNILIKASNNVIQVLSTNLEIGISCQVRGKIEEEGEITAQSRLLSDYIGLLPKDTVELRIDEKDGTSRIFIESKNHSTIINGITSHDYPLIPNIKKTTPIVCETGRLKSAISKSVFAVSVNETRPEINGVFFQYGKKNLTLVGTDSYRLSEAMVQTESGPEKEHNVIVPSRTLQELLRILSIFKDPANIDEAETVKIYITENQVLFSFGSVEMISRLIEGKYPNYKEIIPKNFSSNLSLNTHEFIKSVKTASLFSRNGVYDVRLKILPKESQLLVMSSNNQLGENTSKLDAHIEGVENEVSVNFRFLLDGLSHIDSEETRINVVGTSSPCVFQPSSGQGYLYIVMPIK